MSADLYSTLRWRGARAACLARDGHACTTVLGYDMADEGDEWADVPITCGEKDGLHVHHVERVQDGGDPYALDNLITLCAPCHARLHAMMRAEVSAGISARAPALRAAS